MVAGFHARHYYNRRDLRASTEVAYRHTLKRQQKEGIIVAETLTYGDLQLRLSGALLELESANKLIEVLETIKKGEHFLREGLIAYIGEHDGEEGIDTLKFLLENSQWW